MRTQQEQHEENVEELQDEAKKFTGIIQPVHQKVQDIAESV